jgi:hypothetical protein
MATSARTILAGAAPTGRRAPLDLQRQDDAKAHPYTTSLEVTLRRAMVCPDRGFHPALTDQGGSSGPW